MTPGSESLRYTGHLLRRAQQLHAAVWLRDVSTETTSVQFAALIALNEQPRASQRELGRALDVDRSTTAGLVGRMVRRGLIERRRHDRDQRRNVLELTADGRAELQRLRPRVAAIEPTLTGGLSAAERVELRRLLQAVLEHAAAASASASDGGRPGSNPDRRR